jgi:camelysin-like metallo-endopeptidase
MGRTARRPSRRAARVALAAAPLIGLFIAVALVWQSSYAAFSGTTSNGPNNWTAGTVSISDNDSNTAMFTATGLKPGDTASRCIQVTKAGTLAGAVRLYGSGLTTTNALSSHLQITVEQGTGAVSSGSCANFSAGGATVYSGALAGFTATTFGGGYGDWAPAAGTEARTFRFTYTLVSTAPNSTQGGTAGITFVWEAQNS